MRAKLFLLLGLLSVTGLLLAGCCPQLLALDAR